MARVLWVSAETPDRNGQGGQRRQFHQISALLARGHDIVVLVPASVQDDRSLRQIVVVRRPRLHIRGRFGPLLIRRAHRIVADSRWDAIIVSHHESWWLVPERTPSLAPVLLDVHNVLSHWHQAAGRDEEARVAFADEARAVEKATAVTTCSATESRRLENMHGAARGKTFAAPLGVDPAEWPDENFERAEPIVAMFGMWAWRPNALGLEWFLDEVWPRVRAVLHDAIALVAGSGVDDAEGWPDGARFVGRVPDIAAFTASATVVAVPVLEGVGASVKFAEALASGASVAATPDGANAFERPPAFVSADPVAWASWIIERLQLRGEEAAPAASRAIAFRDMTWDAAVAPVDEWLRAASTGRHSAPPVSS